MKKLTIAALALAMLVGGQSELAYAGHKAGHPIPPGLQGRQLVCGCLATKIQQSIFDNSNRLVLDRSLRNVVGVLTVLGSMECTEPDPGFVGSGEATLRAVLFLLDGIQAHDQEFCQNKSN